MFDDDTINARELPLNDRKLYREWSNPKRWNKLKGATTQTTRIKMTRFKTLVERYGQRKIYRHVLNAVNNKLSNYSLIKPVSLFLPNYSKRTDELEEFEAIKKRVCQSCGRDISEQHQKSTYCSAIYVCYAAAYQCRNAASNPHNNRRRKVARINSKGVLFDIEPYLFNSA